MARGWDAIGVDPLEHCPLVDIVDIVDVLPLMTIILPSRVFIRTTSALGFAGFPLPSADLVPARDLETAESCHGSEALELNG
jgi:hypothetical protein